MKINSSVYSVYNKSVKIVKEYKVQEYTIEKTKQSLFAENMTPYQENSRQLSQKESGNLRMFG